MTGSNAVADNGNGNGKSTEDGVTDRYYLGKASAAEINSVKQLVELQTTCDEVMATYEPLVTEYQQALETANPKVNVAEATKAFRRHWERLIKNKWLNEDHSLATLRTEIHATIQEWWSDTLDEEFEDEPKVPNEGAPGSAEPGDDDNVLKQPLGMGSQKSNANAKKNPATDSGAAKGDEKLAKKKAAKQGNGAKKAQGKSRLKEQAHAMAEKVTYEVVKAFTPKKTDPSSDLAANLIKISLVPTTTQDDSISGLLASAMSPVQHRESTAETKLITKSSPTTEAWNGSSGHVSDIDQVVSQDELIKYLKENFDGEVNMQTKVYVNTVVMAKFDVPDFDKMRCNLVNGWPLDYVVDAKTTVKAVNGKGKDTLYNYALIKSDFQHRFLTLEEQPSLLKKYPQCHHTGCNNFPFIFATAKDKENTFICSMEHWDPNTIKPKCQNQKCNNDVLPMKFGTEVRMHLVCSLECMDEVYDQQEPSAKDDQLFSESFENSMIDQPTTKQDQEAHKLDLILLKLQQLSNQHDMDKLKAAANTDMLFREARKESIARENARQQEMMEFVKVTTEAQVKLSIDQVSAEYAVTGSMLERKLIQMQASVEQIAASTSERFQQLEMQVNQTQPAQAPEKEMRKVEEIEQHYEQAWQFEEEQKSDWAMLEDDEKILPDAGWDDAVNEVENGAGWSDLHDETPRTFQFKLEPVSVIRQPMKAPSKGEDLEELQLQAALLASKETVMVNSVQRSDGAQSAEPGGKDEKEEQERRSEAQADESMNQPPFNQDVYDHYKQQLSEGKLLKRRVRSGKNYLRNADQRFTGQLTNIVQDRMFLFDDWIIEKMLEINVRVLVDGVEERIQYTIDMLLDDLARHIFVMSDDKARVEDACRPVYQWEIDAMTNVSGTSQKLEANTFDELKGLEHHEREEQSAKAEEEAEYLEEAELLILEKDEPAPTTASKLPRSKTKRVGEMVPRHITTGKLITCQKMGCKLAAQMKTKEDASTSPWMCEIHEEMQNDGIGYQQIFKDGRLVKVEHVRLVDKLEAVCVLNGCAHYTKRTKEACCEEHGHLHARGLTLYSDSDSEAEYQPAETIPRLSKSYKVVKNKIVRLNEDLRLLQKGKDDQITKYNKARKLQIAGVNAHAKQLGDNYSQEQVQAVVTRKYAEMDDQNEFVWEEDQEDQYQLLTKQAYDNRARYNVRMQEILLQLKFAKSANKARKEAKAASVAAATKEERARVSTQQMYREEQHDMVDECILRKCSNPARIEEIITRDDGTKEFINVCSIDHLNDYIHQREELILWRAEQARQAGQRSQKEAKQAKKAAKSLIYSEAHPDDAGMHDDEDEEDMDHYEDDPRDPWLVPEGRGDSWQGAEDGDSDTNDGDHTVPSFTEPGDFDPDDDEDILYEEEDEDEDDDEEEELPQRPVHVDRSERVRQDFRIRDFAHEVLKKFLMIGKAIRLEKKPHRTTVSTLVKRWPEGPRAYNLTRAMEADREAWLALNKEQRAASDRQHQYAKCKRKYVPGTFAQAKAVAQEDKPSQRHVKVYTDFKAHGVMDLLNFVRAMNRLRHLPVATMKIEQSLNKFRGPGDSEEINDVLEGAAYIATEHPNVYVEGVSTKLAKGVLVVVEEEDPIKGERVNASKHGGEADIGSNRTVNIDSQQFDADLSTNLDFGFQPDRRKTVGEVLVDKQVDAQKAMQAQHQEMVTQLAENTGATMEALAKTMDRRTKPPELPMVVDKKGFQVISMHQFQAVMPHYTAMEACVHLSKLQKKSKEQYTTQASTVINDEEESLNVDIETGEYTGPGSGQRKLANGRVDPKDALRSEAYYQELLSRFYDAWKGDYGDEVATQVTANVKDVCDRQRLKYRMENGACIRVHWKACKHIRMVYIRHKVPFTFADLWKLFLSRLKPRCVRKFLRRNTKYWTRLMAAEVTFSDFGEYLLEHSDINVDNRNDSKNSKRAGNQPRDP